MEGGWKLISIEFSGREGAREALCERGEVLQHISATFTRNYLYPTADMVLWNNSCTRENLIKKMDQIYCPCDIYVLALPWITCSNRKN